MKTKRLVLFGALVAFLAAQAGSVMAHCDTMQGPVIIDARTALAKGDVTPVLKWVAPKAEGRIKAVFKKALAAQSRDAAAREKAEKRFFETLVKIHRTGEGAPFTGLKEGAPEPVIAAADGALEKGDAAELSTEVSQMVAKAIQEKFQRAVEARKHADESVEKGREYVEAYIQYVHYVEKVHMISADGSAHGHGDEAGEGHSGGE